MKAILEFNLDEERHQFEDAIDGWKWKCIVSELDNELRSKVKYPSDDANDEVLDALAKFREFLHDQLREEGLLL
jgi:hypothetical protein